MKILLACSVFFGMLVGGCTTVTETGYYWGNYSSTLYQHTKAPSEETLAKHLDGLSDIVDTSREKGLKVPPGIHAEIGYIKDKQGKSKESSAHYGAEVELYPESKVFLERIQTINNEAG